MKARVVLGAALGAAAALAALCSCGLLFDVDSLGRGAAADADAALPSDPDAAVDGSAEASGACPSLHGPPMIDADGRCIDATEVTVADYEPFIATAQKVLPLATPCDWVTTFEPDDFATQKATPDHPVVNVNYCHALHYCKWAGKRLCGRVSGGAAAEGDAGADPRTNDWLRACTHEGEQAYSYGPTVFVSACPNKIGPVKTRGACGGAYPGLFDMLGNAGEWIDACSMNGGTRQRDGCTIMGYERVRDEGSCYHLTELSRYATASDLGFRCCGM